MVFFLSGCVGLLHSICRRNCNGSNRNNYVVFLFSLSKKFRRDPLLQRFFSQLILTTTLFFPFLSFSFLSLFFPPSFFFFYSPSLFFFFFPPLLPTVAVVATFQPTLTSGPPSHPSGRLFSPLPFPLFLLQNKIPFTLSLNAAFPSPHTMAYHVTLFCEVVVALKRAFGVMMRRWWLLVAAGADRPRAHTPTS